MTRLFRKLVVSAFVVLLALPWALPARAQVLYGSVVGNVEDSSGATLPGATVTLTNQGTGLVQTAVTGETGSLHVHERAGGHLRRESQPAGLQGGRADRRAGHGQHREPRGLAAGAGRLTESITVVSETNLLQTDKADTHTELKAATIQTLPLDQNRNYQTLINLVPGATPGRQQNSEVDTPGRALTTNVNGMDRNTNGTKTDGATNVNIWLPHHTMYTSPAETIDTVNVSTSNFDAEQGNAGGAAITVITKSGTNEFRGSAFAFYNNESFNAQVVLRDGEAQGELAHRWRDAGRADREEQAVLLRRLGRPVPEDAVPVLLQRAHGGAASRRLQRGAQPGRQPAGDLRPDNGQRRTAPAACPSLATASRLTNSATSPSRFRRSIRIPTPLGASQTATSAGRASSTITSASRTASSTATTTTSRSTTTSRRRARSGASTRAWAPP